MAIKVLIGGWTEEEVQTIKTFSTERKIDELINVNKSDGEKIVGDLAKEGTDAFGELLNERLILFYGLSNKQISKYIDGFKKLGLASPLFAMVTPHSVKWTINDLVEHLCEEREEMRKKMKK